MRSTRFAPRSKYGKTHPAQPPAAKRGAAEQRIESPVVAELRQSTSYETKNLRVRRKEVHLEESASTIAEGFEALKALNEAANSLGVPEGTRWPGDIPTGLELFETAQFLLNLADASGEPQGVRLKDTPMVAMPGGKTNQIVQSWLQAEESRSWGFENGALGGLGYSITVQDKE